MGLNSRGPKIHGAPIRRGLIPTGTRFDGHWGPLTIQCTVRLHRAFNPTKAQPVCDDGPSAPPCGRVVARESPGTPGWGPNRPSNGECDHGSSSHMAIVRRICDTDAWVRLAFLVAWVPGPSLGDPAGPYLATWAPMASELKPTRGERIPANVVVMLCLMRSAVTTKASRRDPMSGQRMCTDKLPRHDRHTHTETQASNRTCMHTCTSRANKHTRPCTLGHTKQSHMQKKQHTHTHEATHTHTHTYTSHSHIDELTHNDTCTKTMEHTCQHNHTCIQM